MLRFGLSRPWRKYSWRGLGVFALAYLALFPELNSHAVAAAVLLNGAVLIEVAFQKRFFDRNRPSSQTQVPDPKAFKPAPAALGVNKADASHDAQAVAFAVDQVLVERNKELLQQLSVFITRQVANDRLDSGRIQREIVKKLDEIATRERAWDQTGQGRPPSQPVS